MRVVYSPMKTVEKLKKLIDLAKENEREIEYISITRGEFSDVMEAVFGGRGLPLLAHQYIIQSHLDNGFKLYGVDIMVEV